MTLKRKEDKIDALRRIVAECQAGKVDGTTVDLFSASAIVSVYDSLNPENQAKYIELPVAKMAQIAFKLTKPKP